MTRMNHIQMRKHLNTDALLETMRSGFARIDDHRSGSVTHKLDGFLIAGFAVFSLKDPSLLAFDERRFAGPHNLMTIYGMGSIPCDTSIRDILDGVDPHDLQPLLKDAFRQLQRGKVIEQYVLMEDSYLLNLDGTEYFSSKNRNSDACLEKRNKKTGEITFYLLMVEAALVHPGKKEVIAFAPEAIKKQDGESKMDCERNAVRRLLGKLRQDHPHLKFIINEDGLGSNGPHIEDLEKYNCHYILGVKQGDHKHLFQYVDDAVGNGEAVELTVTNKTASHLTHCFHIVYDAPLNKKHQNKRAAIPGLS